MFSVCVCVCGVLRIPVLIGPCWQRHLHQIHLLCRRRVQMPRLFPHRWTSQRAAVCAVHDPQPTDGVSQRARRLTSIPIKARPHPGADILRGARFSGRQSRRLCLWCVCFDEAGMRPRCQAPLIFYHCGRPRLSVCVCVRACVRVCVCQSCVKE